LPHQTRDSWEYSLNELIASGVPHASVYMLEVDEDSRLGRELLAGGQKYHAHFVPDEDLTADLYEIACDRLNSAGIQQYEISNFACQGFESKHNLKYWTRQPYLGFGVDAHSMLPCARGDRSHDHGPDRQSVSTASTRYSSADEHEREGHDFQSCRNKAQPTNGTAESRALPAIADKLRLASANTSTTTINAVRFSNPDSMENYVAGGTKARFCVGTESALEEGFFLGLRLNRGVSVVDLERIFGESTVATYKQSVIELVADNLINREDDRICLTPKGRLLSNEVFERFISVTSAL